MRYLRYVMAVAMCCSLLPPPATAQPLPSGIDDTYALSSINPLLMLGNDAVVRLEQQHFKVDNPGKATTRVRRVVTILNTDGREWGELPVWYDKFRELKKFEGRIRNAEGKVIRKLKKEDVDDYSAISDYSLYEDNRVRYARLYHDTYPYTVEFEYELKHKGLISWPTWFPQRGGAPVEFATFEIDAPIGMKVRYAVEGLDLEPEVTERGRRKTLNWTTETIFAFEPEPWGPSLEEQIPVIYTAPTTFKIEGSSGDMSTWETFGQWYYQLSQGRDRLPPALQAEMQQHVAEVPDVIERARRIYQHLQEKTRYVSIQLGIGGWQPFDALYVNERGYGDCKALTNYMMSMLRAADVPAYPALIRNGRRVRDLRADFSCNQFNHVVLFVPTEADTLWLECTSQTIPFGHLGAGNEDRYALVVRPDGGELVRTPRSTAQQNQQVRHARIELQPDGQATAEVKTRYTGNQQDRLRGALAKNSDRDRLDWLRKDIDIPAFDVQGADFSSVDARESEITLPISLLLPRYAASSGKRLFLQPNLMERGYTVPPEMEDRTQPVVYSYAFADTDTLRYLLPEGFTVEALPDPVDLEEPFGRYHAKSVANEDGTLVYHRYFEITETRIAPEHYDAFREFMRQVNKSDTKEQVVLVRAE